MTTNKSHISFFDEHRPFAIPIEMFSFYFYSFLQSCEKSYLLSVDSSETAEMLYKTFFSLSSKNVFYFPERTSRATVPGFVDEFDRYRNDAVLRASENTKRSVFIGTQHSFNEECIPIKNNSLESIFLKSGDDHNTSDIVDFLLSAGFQKTDTVFDPGFFALRGEVLDFFPLNTNRPIRVLFDFDTIKSIYIFDQETQLSEKPINSVKINNTNNNPDLIDNVSLTSLLDSFELFQLSVRDGIVSPDGKHRPNNDKIVTISFHQKAHHDRFVELKKFYEKSKHIYFVGPETLREKYSRFSDSFVWVDGNINCSYFDKNLCTLLISGAQFFNTGFQTNRWVKTQKPVSVLSPSDISTLEIGDFLVHKNFGVGRYGGLRTNRGLSHQRESVEIEFSNNTKVYVSIEKMEFIHRYFGSNKTPKLSTVGSKKWQNEIRKTKKSVELIASELLQLYANKNQERSFSYSKNDDLLNSLKQSFPFIETKDQSKAICDILTDMDTKKPIDRLICGDVGFGKTEVAIRATMKAVTSNKQVLFLCPTTILADQHYITCKERLGPLGVEIGLLSRFKSKKEQSNILNLIKNNKIDVVVGTHRLLSDDVFVPSLGLLIVDEEHRFGVNHKEKIRTMKQQVDVLTLTATPIPRTLQQSLVGIRDVSLIQTPPKTRKPINTSVQYFSWNKIYTSVEFELKRSGQVYFLHNDIKALPFITDKIQERFSHHIVENIHGQMSSKELESKILSFFDGGIDVLVCTTIIESGLDVTNANTIIINDAQNLGLSQLYQIRGRVGRGENQAHCLLFIPNKPLEKSAYRRLKTIEQNTTLGSGYTISLQDLEIRGAGSLFGYKQSGHISNIGFELYCELLKSEIEKINGTEKTNRYPEVVFNDHALISELYITNPTQRLDFYNKLSMCSSVNDVVQIQSEVKDRFGKLPAETKNLLHIARLRTLYKNSSVSKLMVQTTGLLFELDDIKPFDSLDLLFAGVGGFSSENLVGHRFGKTKSGALTITLSTLNFKSAKSLSLECSQLFSVSKGG